MKTQENINSNLQDQEMIQINELINILDYENANILLHEKLKKEPNNVELLDTLSEVLMSLDNTKEAVEVIRKSIILDPDNNPEKYMTIGQLSEYKTSLKYFLKGIELFLKELNFCDEDKKSSLNCSIANAYASIAELYMTSDLCNEYNAEELCEKYLFEALKYDPVSFDALIQLSNLRILRCRDNEALELMEKIYNDILKLVENGKDGIPNQDILSNLAKNYSELEIFNKAIKIYDIIVKINDEDLENWYLLAYNHFKIQNYKHCMNCLDNLKLISEKVERNIEIEEAANELFQELEKIRISNGLLKNNKLEESDDDEERMNNISNDEMNID